MYEGPAKIQAPTACPRCGSIHFQLAHFAEYLRPQGTPPQLLSETVQLLVCVCGHVLPAGLNLKKEEYSTLKQSLEAAESCREQKSGRSPVEVAEEFVTQAEFQKIVGKLGALETELQMLSKKKPK